MISIPTLAKPCENATMTTKKNADNNMVIAKCMDGLDQRWIGLRHVFPYEIAYSLGSGCDPLGGKGDRHPSSIRAAPPVGSTLLAKALSQGLADDDRETETAGQGLASANAQGLANDLREHKRRW